MDMSTSTKRGSRMKKYEDIRVSLKTGDLVLFEGKSLFSKIIRRASGSRWSHVGMILKRQEFDYLALYESTGGGSLPDLVHGVPVKGVQLVPLSDRILNYEGDVRFVC